MKAIVLKFSTKPLYAIIAALFITGPLRAEVLPRFPGPSVEEEKAEEFPGLAGRALTQPPLRRCQFSLASLAAFSYLAGPVLGIGVALYLEVEQEKYRKKLTLATVAGDLKLLESQWSHLLASDPKFSHRLARTALQQLQLPLARALIEKTPKQSFTPEQWEMLAKDFLELQMLPGALDWTLGQRLASEAPTTFRPAFLRKALEDGGPQLADRFFTPGLDYSQGWAMANLGNQFLARRDLPRLTYLHQIGALKGQEGYLILEAINHGHTEGLAFLLDVGATIPEEYRQISNKQILASPPLTAAFLAHASESEVTRLRTAQTLTAEKVRP